MPRRREHPFPNLAMSLESLPPPGNVKRDQRRVLRFTTEEMAKVESAARERGEPPAVFVRTVILTAFESSALRALGQKPDLLDMAPAEQQKVVMEAFAFDTPQRRPSASPELLPPPPEGLNREKALTLALTKAEEAMIGKAARERGEQPALFLRNLVLAVIRNSELRASGTKPNILEMSVLEQQRALLDAFAFE